MWRYVSVDFTDTDIDSLLKGTDNLVVRVRNEYDGSLHNQTIEPALQVSIKTYLELMRLALGYLNGRLVGSPAHFPICSIQNDFETKATYTDTTIKLLVEASQPFNNNQ